MIGTTTPLAMDWSNLLHCFESSVTLPGRLSGIAKLRNWALELVRPRIRDDLKIARNRCQSSARTQAISYESAVPRRPRHSHCARAGNYSRPDRFLRGGNRRGHLGAG